MYDELEKKWQAWRKSEDCIIENKYTLVEIILSCNYVFVFQFYLNCDKYIYFCVVFYKYVCYFSLHFPMFI